MSAPESTPTLLASREALAKALAQHGESYDGDCGMYFGCSCGWDNGTDGHNDGYEVHLADALLASGVVREPAEYVAGLDSVIERRRSECFHKGNYAAHDVLTDLRAEIHALTIEAKP